MSNCVYCACVRKQDRLLKGPPSLRSAKQRALLLSGPVKGCSPPHFITEERPRGNDMNIDQPVTCVLRTREGQFVSIRTVRRKTRLYFESNKSKNALVHLWRREKDSKNQMAFCFSYKNCHYFPKVEEDKLLLQKYCEIPNDISESHWFLKSNLRGDEHYGLQSVVAPQKYICIDKFSVLILDILGSHHKYLLITDESMQASVSSTSSAPCVK